jgi:hypothetical protein
MKLKRRTYRVTIDIDVNGTEALREAAEKSVQEGKVLTLAEYRELRRDDPVGCDLRWLFDPGVSPPGTEIHESGAEKVS